MYIVYRRYTLYSVSDHSWQFAKQFRFKFFAQTYAFFGDPAIEYRVYDKNGKFVGGDR